MTNPGNSIEYVEKNLKKANKAISVAYEASAQARSNALGVTIEAYDAAVHLCAANEIAAPDRDKNNKVRDNSLLASLHVSCITQAHTVPDISDQLIRIREVTERRKELLNF